MNTVMTPVPDDHPMMVAWTRYRASEGFENSMRWLAHEEHRLGSMWASFMAGWQAGQARDSIVLDGTQLSRRDLRQLQRQVSLGQQMRVIPSTLPSRWRAVAVGILIGVVLVWAAVLLGLV